MSTALTTISAVQQALAEATAFDDVLDIRHRGHSAVAHAKRARSAKREQLFDAMVGVLLAERRLGKLIAEMGGKGGHGGDRKSSDIVSLEKLGVTNKQSSRWQAEASVAEDKFWAWIEEKRTARAMLSSAELIRLASGSAVQPIVTASVTSLNELISQGQQFACIYADPPWPYDNRATRAAAAKHYPTMSLDALKTEPVIDVAAENAHLHLWTTNAFLPCAFDVLNAWGFEYKSVFVWVKPQLGIGNYWRVSHEFLLLGIRGRCLFRDRRQPSWLEVKRTRHSRKPRQVRELVEQVSPGPYLEMYGTEEIDGWTVYGNRIERKLIA